MLGSLLFVGTGGANMISCQVALYPLATENFENVIIEALESIKLFTERGLIIEVGSMSTIIRGNDELVFQAVKMLFNEASKDGRRIVLNTQFSNECGCKNSF